MSIASRIEAIEQHLTDDYSVLTLAGADLTNVDKNILNLKLTWKERLLYFMNNGTQVIWNNWNKVSGTGTTLSLNNTEEAPMSLTYKGNTQQTGTPAPSSPIPVQVVSGDNSIEVVGKNLFDGELEEGTISTSNGQNASSTTKLRSVNYILVKPETTYYRLFNTTSSDGYLYYYDKNKTLLSTLWYNASANGTFTTPSNCYYLRFITPLNSNPLYMISLGNVAPTTYEAYNGASYPISLGIENLWNEDTQNFSSVSLLSSPIKNTENVWFFKSSGSGYAFAKSDIVLQAGTYTFSSNCINGDTMVLDGGTQLNNTFTINETKTITYRVYKSNAVTGDVITLSNVKLAKGNSTDSVRKKPIELCKIGTYQDKMLKSTGKNLFNPNIEINTTYTSSIATALSNFKSTGKYATGYTSNGTSLSNNANYVTTFTPCQSGVTYTINNTYSAGANFSMICFLDDNGNVINHSTGWTNNAYTHTATSEEKYIMCGINMNDSGVDYRNWVMIEESSSATTYEPYGTGWYLKKEIGKVVFNGTENWAKGTVFYLYNAFSIPALVSNDNSCKSKYFAYKVNALTNYSIYIPARSNIWLRYEEKETANDLKEWISENNFEVYYVLETPTYEYITDTTLLSQLEALKKSYENVTNISQVNNDLPFELDVTALEEMN